jgi:hypothetical protein
VSQIRIAAFDKDLRSEQPLGDAVTDDSGSYSIEYSTNLRQKQGRGVVDLVVRAYDAHDTIVAESPVRFSARQNETIDFTIASEWKPQPTEFEKLKTALEPLLDQGSLGQLEEDNEQQDLTFLSGETGFEKNLVARFVLAQRLLHLGIEREFWFALLGGSFFKYAEKNSLKKNLAIVSAVLRTLNASGVRKALTDSFNRREIPACLHERTEEWIKAFLQLVKRLPLRP